MKTSIVFALLVACILGLSMAQFLSAPSTGFGSGGKLIRSQFFGHSSVVVQTVSLASCIKPLFKIQAITEYSSLRANFPLLTMFPAIFHAILLS